MSLRRVCGEYATSKRRVRNEAATRERRKFGKQRTCLSDDCARNVAKKACSGSRCPAGFRFEKRITGLTSKLPPFWEIVCYFISSGYFARRLRRRTSSSFSNGHFFSFFFKTTFRLITPSRAFEHGQDHQRSIQVVGSTKMFNFSLKGGGILVILRTYQIVK